MKAVHGNYLIVMNGCCCKLLRGSKVLERLVKGSWIDTKGFMLNGGTMDCNVGTRAKETM